jgi:glycosyltransferase involved in cell wall biosynthesis
MLIDFETDLLISFEAATSVITFMASLGKTPQIASERVHPGYHVIPKWAKLARPYIYRQKRVFVHCQGKVISDWISHYYQTPSFVIPNFLGKKINATWSFESNKVKIFSRYCEQKGIDLAIHAWSKLPEYIMKDFTLEIFGDGDRKEFENLVQELGLTQNIKLYGATKDMAIELSDCKLFLLPSRFEGFPNSLAEAIGAGIPSIATDCPSAIRDLTLNGDLAVLTKPTADSISESIVSLLADSQLQFKLNKDGGNLNQIFDEKIILDQWLELINYALNSKS